MRLRNVPGSQERILNDAFTIQTDGENGEDFKGLWNQNFFHNDHPIHIEIGMGKGQFITQMAKENPDINYIGIEKYSSVLVRALDKRADLELENLRFMRMDAEDITSYFAPDEISKRRLTSRCFLERYDKILTKDGYVQFKTDNRPLFDFSLEELNAMNWIKDEVSFDLHKDGPAPNNVMTEYEQKFYAEGKPICRFVAHR